MTSHHPLTWKPTALTPTVPSRAQHFCQRRLCELLRHLLHFFCRPDCCTKARFIHDFVRLINSFIDWSLGLARLMASPTLARPEAKLSIALELASAARLEQQRCYPRVAYSELLQFRYSSGCWNSSSLSTQKSVNVSITALHWRNSPQFPVPLNCSLQHYSDSSFDHGIEPEAFFLRADLFITKLLTLKSIPLLLLCCKNPHRSKIESIFQTVSNLLLVIILLNKFC